MLVSEIMNSGTVNYSVEIYLVPKTANETTGAALQAVTLPIKTYSVMLNHNETSVIPFDLTVPDAKLRPFWIFLLFDETLSGRDIFRAQPGERELSQPPSLV